MTCNEIIVVVDSRVENPRRHGVFVDIFDVDVESDDAGPRRRRRYIVDDDGDKVFLPVLVIECLQRLQRPHGIGRTFDGEGVADGGVGDVGNAYIERRLVIDVFVVVTDVETNHRTRRFVFMPRNWLSLLSFVLQKKKFYSFQFPFAK